MRRRDCSRGSRRANCSRRCKRLETRLGRAAPVVRWGPRRIDLDLLVHGDARIDEPGLCRSASRSRRAQFRAVSSRGHRAGAARPGAGPGARPARGDRRDRRLAVLPVMSPRAGQSMSRRRCSTRIATSSSKGRSASARRASRGGWRAASAASWCSSRASENPFLERFYRNPRAAAFQTQLYFLFQRARQLQDLRQHDLFETRARRRLPARQGPAVRAAHARRRGVRALRAGVRAARARRARSRTSSSTCRRRSTCCSTRIARRGIAYEQQHRAALPGAAAARRTRASSSSTSGAAPDRQCGGDRPRRQRRRLQAAARRGPAPPPRPPLLQPAQEPV